MRATSYKVFTDLGHGGLAGKQTAQFAEEVKTAHARSLLSLENQMFSEATTPQIYSRKPF